MSPLPATPKVLVVSLWHEAGTVRARLRWADVDGRWPAAAATAVVTGRVRILETVWDLTVALLEEREKNS